MPPESPSALANILFDQRSRYESLAQAIRAMLPTCGTVLDVGCGEAMLLKRFLPDHRITFVDPLLAGRDAASGVIGAPFSDDVVPDAAFDVAVCVDVLEHVPADERPAFLQRLIKKSRHGVVVSAPFADATGAAAVDARVCAAYRHRNDRDYPWLAEHEAYGLPDLAATRRLCEQAGLATVVAGNGHVPWLADLLSLHVVLLDNPVHRPLLHAIGDRFAAAMLPFEHLSPSYRMLVVADRRGPVALPQAADDADTRARADAAWRDFRSWVDAQMGRCLDALAVPNTELPALRTRVTQLQKDLEALRRQQQQLKETFRREANTLRAAHEHERQTVAVLQQSLSWRLTAPLRLLGRLLAPVTAAVRRALLALAYACLRLVPKRLVWPLKKAFFSLFRPLLRGSRELREFDDADKWRRAERPEVAPVVAAGHAQLHDVVVFGVIDWHLRIQRPQQLSLELARRGHRLFFLTPGFAKAEEPGYRLRRLDDTLPLYEVRLQVAERTSIYDGAPDPERGAVLAAGLRRFLRDVGIDTSIGLVEHPGWVDLAALLPRTTLVYDCMDNHHGFAEAGAQLPADERRLVALADSVVVTSDHLAAEMRPLHRHVCMVRNGCEPAHFAAAIRSDSPRPRPVIGYFGAIAQWFDAALVRDAARVLPHCDFLLVGDDTAGVKARLRDLRNVRFTGEIPYAELAPLVERMDVLFIPFVIDALTLATNPVKAYEALAAGKPVVATAMPELMNTDLAPFVHVGATPGEFVRKLGEAIAECADADRRAARIAFAQQQSWSHRAAELDAAVQASPAQRVAAVVVSWNGRALTERCVRSLLDDRLAQALDVIVVDNASTDDTPQWLDVVERDPRVHVIRNAENRGFAAACNQGLAAGAALGADLLAILNNDIVVTPGWARTLGNHLRRDPAIGLIGPVTNNIGNEARVPTTYADLDAMPTEQRALTGAKAGLSFDIPVLAFFCVAMPRDVYEQVGDLDTGYGMGFFEDDDYCQRVRALGRRVVCAEDVFVHHELSASFDRIDQEERQRLFEKNRAYYESKWGPWRRHVYRTDARAAGGDSAAAG